MEDLFSKPDTWNLLADGYDGSMRHFLSPYKIKVLEFAEVKSEDFAVDIACGPGTLTLDLAEKAKSVDAIDFSDKMIAILSKKAESYDNIYVQVGDAQNLEVEDERYSLAVSLFGIIFCPDPTKGLEEMYRVLAFGGRGVVTSWPPMHNSPYMEPLLNALKKVMPWYKPEAAAFAFQDRGSLEKALNKAGFSDIQVSEFSPTFCISSPVDYWQEALEGNALINHFRRLSGSRWESIEKRILEELYVSLEGGKELVMPSLMAKGRKV
jgi:ubiquinone/menaquinone biosynthesis C-methylase UbiE